MVKNFLDYYNAVNKRKRKTSEEKEYTKHLQYVKNKSYSENKDQYDEARKSMGYSQDDRLTKQKYDSYIGNEETGNKGIYGRMQEYYKEHPERQTVQQEQGKPFKNSKELKVNNNQEKANKPSSFDKTIDKTLGGLGDFINKVKNSKIVQGTEELVKKIDDNKIGHAYGEVAKQVFKHSPVGQKVEDVKTFNKAMPLVDQYGGAASTRNVLSDVTDKKDQSAKDYLNDIKGGFSGKKKTSGEDLAKQWGNDSKYGSKLEGLGIEAVADPTNLIGLGIGSKVLKTASKLGKLGKITEEGLKAAEVEKTLANVNKSGKVSKSEAKKIVNSLSTLNKNKAAEQLANQITPTEVVKTEQYKPKSLNDLVASSKVKQEAELIQPKTINQKPVDYAAQKNELQTIHAADREQFAKQNNDVIQAVSGERQAAVNQFNKEDVEWQGHIEAAKQYDDIMKSVGGRLNIPEGNMSDFASQLGKHQYSAAGKGQGDDIYKVADDLGFNNPDELIQTLNNGYASKQIVKAGKNKFFTVDGKKLQDPNPEAIIDEMHSQTATAQQLQNDMAKMDQLHQEQLNAAALPEKTSVPLNVLSKNATNSEKLQIALDQAKTSNDPKVHESIIKHSNDLIKELESKELTSLKGEDGQPLTDQEIEMVKDDIKGLKLNLQLFAGNQMTKEEMLAKIERINKQAERLLKTRKGHLDLQNMTPDQLVDHHIERLQANVDYLQSKIDDIDQLVNEPHGNGWNELRDLHESKLIKAQQNLDVAHEVRGDLGNLQSLKDVNNISTPLIKPMRLIEKSFGKDSEVFHSLTEQQQVSRNLHSDLHNEAYDTIKSVENLIGKKKKDSAFLQDWGEKTLLKQQLEKDGVPSDVIEKMTDQELNNLNVKLIQQLRPKDWNNFVQADELARKFYNQKIEQYNKVMQETYPNDKTKLIPFRKDYYHHFNEMGEGWASIFNRLKNEKASKIAPKYEGLSKITKPATQWVGQKMARMGGAYKSDAIGGMVKSAQDLNKAIAWTPMVGKLRSYKKVLEIATEHSANLNNVLRTMDNYAGKLANKSGDMDRWLGDNVMGRAGVGILHAVSNMIKNNVLSHSFRVVFAQGLTIPHAVASAKTENIVKGLPNAMNYLLRKGGPAAESPFLKERFGTKKFEDFKHGAIQTFIKTGHLLPELADKVTVPVYWNGIYADLLSKNKKLIKNGIVPQDLKERLINEADKLTSEVVGGRGVGDKSFAQESKVYNTLDPFQLEPQSQWLAFGRMKDEILSGVKNKDIRQLASGTRKVAEWGIYSALVGQAYLYLTGSDAALNPIEDIKKGMKEGSSLKNKLGLTARNLAGDVITSGGVPMAQMLGGALGLAGQNSEKVFGKNDPFRFSQNGLLISKPIQEMINGNGLASDDNLGGKIINHLPLSVLLPGGEGALVRAKKGYKATKEGGVYSKTHPEKMLYPVGDDWKTKLRVMTMGVNSTKNAQKFYEQDNPSGLSMYQTLDVLKKGTAKEREKAWNDILDNKGKKNKGPKASTVAKQKKAMADINKLKRK